MNYYGNNNLALIKGRPVDFNRTSISVKTLNIFTFFALNLIKNFTPVNLTILIKWTNSLKDPKFAQEETEKQNIPISTKQI